jgi:hypothetical protein
MMCGVFTGEELPLSLSRGICPSLLHFVVVVVVVVEFNVCVTPATVRKPERKRETRREDDVPPPKSFRLAFGLHAEVQWRAAVLYVASLALVLMRFFFFFFSLSCVCVC